MADQQLLMCRAEPEAYEKLHLQLICLEDQRRKSERLLHVSKL